MSILRKFLQMTVILAMLLSVPCVSAAEETLYVFYPLPIRPVIMQKKMSQACPGIRIMAFGRFTDFEARVLADKPDAILTKQLVIRRIGGYSVALKGSRKGEIRERNILVSADKQIDLKNISSVTIGMLDILGRDGMKELAGSYFSKSPRLRLASKREDMLQLLIFRMVEAILIPESQLGYFKELANMNFMVTPLPNIRSDIITLATINGSSGAITVRSLTRMDGKIMEMLEVDKWEK